MSKIHKCAEKITKWAAESFKMKIDKSKQAEAGEY